MGEVSYRPILLLLTQPYYYSTDFKLGSGRLPRLAWLDSDKQVRDWFINYAKSLGCNTFVDQMGNL